MTLTTIQAILNIALTVLKIGKIVFEMIERWLPTILS